MRSPVRMRTATSTPGRPSDDRQAAPAGSSIPIARSRATSPEAHQRAVVRRPGPECRRCARDAVQLAGDLDQQLAVRASRVAPTAPWRHSRASSSASRSTESPRAASRAGSTSHSGSPLPATRTDLGLLGPRHRAQRVLEVLGQPPEQRVVRLAPRSLSGRPGACDVHRPRRDRPAPRSPARPCTSAGTPTAASSMRSRTFDQTSSGSR